MAIPLPELSTGSRQGTSELSGNVRTPASKTAMKQVVDRMSWISFDLIKVLSV